VPSLRALLDAVGEVTASRGQQLSVEDLRTVERHVRALWPAERVYIPPVGSRKDPERRVKIRETAKKLPTGIAAERLGVSESWVHRVMKQPK